MIAFSLISRLRQFKNWFLCNFKYGHDWLVLMSPSTHDGYEVLVICKRCGKKRWVHSLHRIEPGTILKEL